MFYVFQIVRKLILIILFLKKQKKFIDSKEHQSEKNLQQKLFEGFPKSYHGKQPENVLIAYRIFQNTFLKKLNKTFNVND